MHKGCILTGVVTAALALSFSASAFAADPKVTWNFSVWGKKRAFTAGIHKLSDIVAAKTGDKFTIKVHYGTLSKPKENLDGIKLGAFQGAMSCNFYHPGKNPAHMIFSLPFLPMSSWRASVVVRDTLFEHPALKKELDRWDAVAYLPTYLPQYEFMGKGEPPAALKDFKGWRVRAGGGIGDAMVVLGATKQTMPATEVYTAISRGTSDAVSFPFTYAFASYKVHEVADWFTSNMSVGSAECPILFNKHAMAKLPAKYKKIMDDAKDEVREAMIAAYQDLDKKNLPMFKSKLKEVRYSEDQLAEFRRVGGEPIWKKWVEKNQGKFDAQGLLDLALKTAAAVQ